MFKGKKILFIFLVAAFGVFLIADNSKAACVNKDLCCKCYSGYIGEDVASYASKFESEAEASSAATCNTACIRALPNATYYIYGNNNQFIDINRGTAGATVTPLQSQPQATSDVIPGTFDPNSTKGLVKCGHAGQRMCTLCDIVLGLNVIIKYIMGISLFVALAVFVIGAVMYIVSAGDTGMITKAKDAMKNAAIGIVIIFAAWLIVNYTIQILGTKSNLGITRVSGWSNFTCN